MELCILSIAMDYVHTALTLYACGTCLYKSAQLLLIIHTYILGSPFGFPYSRKQGLKNRRSCGILTF